MVNVILYYVRMNLQFMRNCDKVGAHPTLFYIQEMNRVNSHNGNAMMTAP